VKTIFITSLNPFVTRNILLTDVFRILRQTPDLKIVIFCPNFKVDYFRDNFNFSNVIIESIVPQVSSFQDSLFKFITGSLLDNRTRYIHQRRQLRRDKKLFRFLVSRALAKLGRFGVVKSAVRFLDSATVSHKKYKDYFNKYQPDFVFCPDVFHDDDARVLAAAKSRGIKTIGMVRTWDNINNKGLFRVKPDILLVSNKIVRQEAIDYEGMKAEDIRVVGMPQFDYYVTSERTPREDFFKRINLDPKKRLIMFSPHGIRFHSTDWHIMQMLKDARANGDIPENTQILVRFPPNDDVSLGDFIPDNNFFIDRPAQMFKGGLYRDQELSKEAMVHLADSLYYSDIVIAYNSSLIIDAAAYGKPSIGVAFDGWDKVSNIYESVARFMEYDHTQHLLRVNGLWVVRSREELIGAVNKYLDNPGYNTEGRRRVIKTQVGEFDGKDGERLANLIISKIKSEI